MGNMSPDCISRLDDLICKDSKEVGNQALRGLYGQQSCCNDLQSLFKAVLIKGIQVKYNNPDASSPPIVLRAINKKQAECYCNWIDRQFPNDVTGGGGGGGLWGVEYTAPLDSITDLTTSYTWQPITGRVDIESSTGSWENDPIRGENIIYYRGNTTRTFDVVVTIAMSTQTPRSIEYSYEKQEGGPPGSFEFTPQATGNTAGGGVPHAPVSFTFTWSPQASGDFVSITARDLVGPVVPLTLTTFDVVITEQ
jgi:hypothetical protein